MRDFNRIRIGRHYPIDSPVHALDPRVKILCALGIIVMVFLIPSGYGLAILLIGMFAVILVAKLPPLQIIRGLRSVLVLLFIAGFFQLIFASGQVLWRIGPINITNAGVTNGVFFPLRIIIMALTMSVLTLSTTPVQLLDGVEALLRPLIRVGIPAYEVSLVLSIALRFLPNVLAIAGDLVKAQISRGADFESKNVWRRSRSLLPLLIPLFAASFRDAEQLARAMSSRGYRGGERRGHYRIYGMSASDWLALTGTAAVLAAVKVIPF